MTPEQVHYWVNFKQPEGLPTVTSSARTMACEDCAGQGEVGPSMPQGEFQPTERERCESCNGSGVWVLPAASNAPIDAEKLHEFKVGLSEYGIAMFHGQGEKARVLADVLASMFVNRDAA